MYLLYILIYTVQFLYMSAEGNKVIYILMYTNFDFIFVDY